MKKFNLLMVFCLMILVLNAPISYGKVNTMKLAESEHPGHPLVDSMTYFKEKVNELSKGKSEVNLYASGVLGGEKDTIEELLIGSLQLTRVALAPLTTYNEKLNAFYLPFLFKDRNQLIAIRGSSFEKVLMKEFEKAGFKLIALLPDANRCMYSKKPIRSPKDLKGLKYRVMESDILIKSINAMGGSATPMAYSEVYTALQTGVLDAMDNTAAAYTANKFYEVTPYFDDTAHFANPSILISSLAYFNSLPKDMQKAMLQAGKLTETFFTKKLNEKDKQAREEIVKLGKTIISKKDIDIAAFKASVQKVYKEYEPKYGAFLKKLVEFSEKQK
jgi:tripartite ATP-independent transporter DctP family solute receptor